MALEIKRDYIKPRVLRMNMLKTEQEYEQALEDAKMIDELDPKYPDMQKIKGELVQLSKKKLEKMSNSVVENIKN